MNKSLFRVAVLALLVAVTLVSTTSCNKGYGCPTDFKISIGK